MDDKLTREQCERLLSIITGVMENEALRSTDAIKLIDVLLEACKREKIDTEEKMLMERFRL